MRAVVQRVSRAEVRAEGSVSGRIDAGLLVLLAIGVLDTEEDQDWLIRRILRLKLFPDETGRMSKNVVEAGGGLLVVSQFTLLASTRKGSQPSWHRAAPPPQAREAFAVFTAALGTASGLPVATGVFGAEMAVELVNDGPVTLVLDSQLRE
jgi:D-tyrosyl-tRNA(Tyr) deacylase